MILNTIAKWANWFRRWVTGEESLIRSLNRWRVQSDLRNRRTIVRGYPYEAYIDICNYCNLQCPLCPTGQGRKERQKGMMSLDTFEIIMNQIGKYLYTVRLDSWGEPLLNKEIFQIIRCAAGYGIKVSFSTNLNVLGDEEAEQLVSSGLSELLVSMDGATQDTYQQYRRGGNLQTVIENIGKIQHFKKALHRKTPKISALFLVMRHNEHEIEAVKALAKQLKIETIIGPLRVDTGREITEPLSSLITEGERWLPTNPVWQRYNIESKQSYRPRSICEILWTSVTVNPDGAVSPCCAVYPQKYDYGNIRNTPFKKIWNNEYYVRSRALFTKSCANDGTVQADLVCSICKGNGLLSR